MKFAFCTLATSPVVFSLVLLALGASISNAAEFKFKCPESIPTKAGRDKHYNEFFDDYVKKNPNKELPDFVEYRFKMLEKYKCKETLENIKRNSPDDSSDDNQSETTSSKATSSKNINVWYKREGKKCVTDPGPADMIKNLKQGGLQYKTTDIKAINGKPVIVKITIFESLGSTDWFYYRGKEVCQAEIVNKKKTDDAEIKKYR